MDIALERMVGAVAFDTLPPRQRCQWHLAKALGYYGDRNHRPKVTFIKARESQHATKPRIDAIPLRVLLKISKPNVSSKVN